tara:strand:- start:80 stop:592 length:513 start_codon:yes stop_codon:yes gene_type:complete
MEWLGLLLLYVISGYMKKRQQAEKRKEIENEPDWDKGSDFDNRGRSDNIEIFLNDLFESNPKIPDPAPLAKEIIENENNQFIADDSNIDGGLVKKDEKYDDEDLTEIDEQVEQFEENIYHSKLSEKKEMQLGNKWSKKRNIRKELFGSKKSLRKSIIVKEILDKPLSIRN